MGEIVEIHIDEVDAWAEPKSSDWLKRASNMDNVGDPRVRERLRFYRLFEDYYDGDHRTKVLDRAKEYLEANGIRFSENFCDLVVDVMADRLKITAWRAENPGKKGDEALDEALSDKLAQIWQRNKGEDEHGVVHTQTVMKGDGFVLVSADAERGALFHFNRPEDVKVVYEDGNPKEKSYAVKRWTEEAKPSPTNPTGLPIFRMNVYWPDRVEKYYKLYEDDDCEWYPHLDPSDEYWPIPWTMDWEPGGAPRGVPVFHFSNKAKGRQYGRSELRKVVPMQDAYNKALLDSFEVLDTQGYPQRWAVGMGRDSTKNLQSTPGSLWSNKNPEGKFGQFDAADLDKIGRMLERKLQSVAGLSQTPVHMIVLTPSGPSGEAIRASESGLVSKVRDRQPSFGNEWEAMMEMCLLIDRDTIGDVDAPEGVRVVAVWSDPETRNLADLLNAALAKQQLGVSKRTILSELGYDDPDAELERSEEEAARIMERNEKIESAGGVPQVQHGS